MSTTEKGAAGNRLLIKVTRDTLPQVKDKYLQRQNEVGFNNILINQ
ncbi:MAG: hypothetical protein ABW185_06155 [Sedimenticola sp.]